MFRGLPGRWLAAGAELPFQQADALQELLPTLLPTSLRHVLQVLGAPLPRHRSQCSQQKALEDPLTLTVQFEIA